MKIFANQAVKKNPFPAWSDAYAIRDSELASMPSKQSLERETNSLRKAMEHDSKKTNIVTLILQKISKLIKPV